MSGTEILPVGDLDYSLEVLPEFNWVSMTLEDGRSLNCTADHPIYHALAGKVRADHLAVGDLLITDVGEMPIKSICRIQRKCSKYKVAMLKGHLFWANGILSHNVKPAPSRGP